MMVEMWQISRGDTSLGGLEGELEMESNHKLVGKLTNGRGCTISGLHVQQHWEYGTKHWAAFIQK